MLNSLLPGMAVTKDVATYTDAGGEQDILEFAFENIKIIRGVFLDLNAMTQDGTIKVYYKIDGTNYRQFRSDQFSVATDPDGLFIDLNFAVTNALKITYEEAGDEGADRAVPYTISYERRY